jgi:hypothetical protein
VRLTDEERFVRVFEVLDEPRAQLDLIDSSSDRASQYSNAYGEVTGGTTIRVSVPVQQTVVLVSVIRLPEVSVTRARTRVGEVGCAISEPHGVRRIVSLRLDPFAVTVGGRVITGSGTAPATVHAPAGSSSLEWLDELDR